MTDVQRQEIIDRRLKGETLKSIAAFYEISESTASRVARGKYRSFL
ncbi:hypothetical protein NBRC3278_1507 [Acetobacter pasteurianus NBRC 3278]|uniref:Insertion element IS150 protein InsJ-like helix-turn-helix domain-containing protein n=3 Tax=Acetobacter pasteurianus TaxID=438 RepID=A0A1Y0Y9R8_ACEPA|nr:hypothetical protein S1001342_02864 [Acetobacter pasteurianus subsp. pasteurianus]GCD54647.1 hypothetical protein NBRC3188_3344 [Acetobacter pasteurianus NBRC 3188]GCD58921.1 hypothetical protein NBRC3277_1496 [Acetobacter pasteurianus NBRC 3277]GCD62414.1 hypothetical protein NBRC3278_1507 [Acetobacter pasteurianus NBRC 3278]GCD67355.1 hypothetical protein NBRC3279_2846 [Acetobacter pasteurianus NBRC 3279]GCD73695.1 hypothetical protein NBRC3284_2851 [Acetobacter pasteurianus NBRC 3284]